MNRITNLLKTLIGFVPLIAALFTLYWLESSGLWTIETPHRGKLSVLVLMIGMGLSFVAYSWLFDRKAERKD
ncbi:MAG: hypothetical protein AAF993_15560 [Pseudomonadota bacterium]